MMKTIRSFHPAVLALAGLLCVGGTQAAEDTPAARQAAAEQLVKSVDELAGPQRMMATLRTAMQAPMQEALKQNQRLTPSQRERASEVLGAALAETMADTMGQLMPTVYNGMVRLYVERFTLAEIEQLQQFYANPVVRKATVLGIEEVPRLMQPMMQSMQQLAGKMKQRLDAANEQLRREGIDLSAKP